jgi:hypothetical protein
MQDGADLALALAGENDWRAAVRDYEVMMWARAEPSAAAAGETMDQIFSENGLAHILQAMEDHRR